MSYSIKSIKKEFAERGVFYTDERLARLLADEVSRYGEVRQVYDPTCGAGNLLAAFGDDVEKYGQEINSDQAEVARQRLTNAHIVTGDTLVEPAFGDMKFRHIVANYPFSIKWRLVGHLHMPSAHYTTYEGVCNGITITIQTANRTLKCGGYGKTRVAYLVGQREFKNKEELIKYLNEK